ncbi:MAG: hypothetical protein ACXVX0_14925 [Blastococcus sp.]
MSSSRSPFVVIRTSTQRSLGVADGVAHSGAGASTSTIAVPMVRR